MFKILKKLIKWLVIYPVLAILGISVALTAFDMYNNWDNISLEIKNTRIENCISDVGIENCTVDGYLTQEFKEQQRLQKQQEQIAAEDQRLRELAAENVRNAAAQQRSRIESQLTTYCMDQIKSSALYPTKVDFHIFKTERRVFENFSNSDKPNRFMFNTGGELMNGFGNMVPFTAVCKVDFNTTEFSLVEVIIQ